MPTVPLTASYQNYQMDRNMDELVDMQAVDFITMSNMSNKSN